MNKAKLRKEFQDIVHTQFSGESGIGDDVFDFSIGDPDLSTDRRIVEFAMQRALEGDTHYGVPSGKSELKEKIVAFHKERLGQDIGVDNVHVTTSASHAMYLVMMALLNPGDEVICLAPYFANYDQQIGLNGGIPVIVNTHYEEEFEVNEKELLEKITPKTKAIIVNNPSNPAGHLLKDESLEILARVAKEKDLIVVCDDIYTTYVYGGRQFKSLSNYPDMFSRTIQIRSFSKDCLMTGWRIGYIVADKELVDVTKAINENIIYSPSAPSQNAAIKALELFDEVTSSVQAIYSKRLDKVYSMISKSKYFTCLPISGTFYVFMNIEKTGMKDREFTAYVMDKARVKVFPGSLFGDDEYADFVRLSINLDVDRIEQAFDRLEALEYKQR